MNIAALIHRNFLQRPQSPALWIGGEVFTYEDFHHLSASLAETIESNIAAGPNVHVGIFAYRSFTAYAGILGALYAGRVYLPLNPRFPSERNERMISVTGAECLIVDSHCASHLEPILRRTQGKLVLMPEHDSLPDWCAEMPQHRFLSASELREPTREFPLDVADEAGAYTVFTSGSTGIPKGVMIRHRNLRSFTENITHLLQITHEDRCTQHFDLTFDASVHDLFATWTTGASLYVVPENAALFGVRFVKEHQITVWYSVPATGTLIAHHKFLKPGVMPSLRLSLFIGEALPSKLAQQWQLAAPRSAVYNLYGPTEATVSVTGLRYREGLPSDSDSVPIGFPHPDHQIAIVDDTLSEVTSGEMGELCVSGPQVASGYFGDPGLTATKFVTLPGRASQLIWYRTGDLVNWTDDFGLHFRGRADRQIKLRGFRVELGEIEIAIRKSAQTDIAAVIGLRAEKSGGFISTVAFVVGSTLKEAEILASCQQLVPDYMVPKQIVFLKELPLNINGKTDFRRLEADYLADQA